MAEEEKFVVGVADTPHELQRLLKEQISRAPKEWMEDRLAHILTMHLLVKGRVMRPEGLSEMLEQFLADAGIKNPVVIDMAGAPIAGEKAN